jgi:hypothetical protein
MIQLELAVFDGRERPEYIALSYEWGSFDDARVIHVNDAFLIITENLHSFLKTLEADGAYVNRWFWADQISMDQTNIQERDHQVGLMGSIYSEAEVVFAYLGKEGDSSLTENALSDLRHWADKIPANKSLLAGLAMMTRSYWGRLWIVQEIRLARSAIFWCGRFQINRNDLYGLSRFLKLESPEVLNKVLVTATGQRAEADRKRAEILRADAVSLWALLQDPENIPTVSLGDVLEKFGHKSCLDPRDKIFGLQALVKPSQRVTADYSLSLEQVFYRVLLAQLSDHQTSRCPAAVWRNEHESTLGHLMRFRYQVPSCLRPKDFERVIRLVCWAYMIARLPTDIDWSECSYYSWHRLWWMVGSQAVTRRQKTLAEDFQILGKQNIESMIAGDTDLTSEQRSSLKWSFMVDKHQPLQTDICKRLAERSRSSLSEAAAKHGFLVFEGLLCHPQDWPFPAATATGTYA